MKRKIKAGGAQKIYYNVNDGKAYLLTEQGLTPIDITGGVEQITEVTETTPGSTETITQTPKSFQYLNEEQQKKLKELQESAPKNFGTSEFSS